MAVPQQQIEQFQVSVNPGQPDERKTQTLEARLLFEVSKRYRLTEISRPRRYYLWLLSSLFAKAIHYIWYDHRTGVVQEWSQEKISKCMYTPSPLLYYAIENLAAQYINSNPKIIPMPINSDDPKIKTVVRALGEYADYLDFEFFRADPHQRQTEAKLIPLRGVYTFLEWDRTGGAKVELPTYEGQQSMLCTDCGYEVPPSGAVPPEMAGGSGETACPHCGSTNIAPSLTGLNNTGTAQNKQGCVRRRVIDSFQVEIFDRNRGIEESPYLIFDDTAFKTRIRKDYPWLKNISGQASLGNSQDGFLGLHYLLQLQTLISNTGRLDQATPDFAAGMVTAGYGGAYLNDSMCWRRRVWLDPEEYADWTTGEIPVQFPGDNRIIPPGSEVAPIFPRGMLIHIVNGNSVVKLENQFKNDVWEYTAYRPPAEGMHGTGVNPLVSLNRGYDEANSFEMQALLMSALGIIIADERVKQVRNIPGSIATIPTSARLPGESINSLVGRLDMGGAQAISAAEPIKEGFRGTIGDLSMAANPQGYGNRPQGVGKETATAARYNAGATNTLVGPPMELYAATKARVIQKAIQLERIYNQRPRMFGKFGETAAKWFDPLQIPEDLRFGAAEESWRPRTLEDERGDVMNAISLGVGMTEFANPAVEDKAMQVFGFDETTDTYMDWAVLGEKKLDALKIALPQVLQEQQALEMQMQQMDPAEAQEMAMAVEQGLMPPPEKMLVGRLIELAGVAPRPLDLEGHVHYTRFWLEQYTSDEFDKYPPLLQDTIEELYVASVDGIGQAGAVKTDQMMTAQAPAMQQQQEQQAAQIEQEQMGEQQAEQQAGETAQGEHLRNQDADETKHKRQLELEDRKHKNNLEIEKVRARNRPKPASKTASKKRR